MTSLSQKQSPKLIPTESAQQTRRKTPTLKCDFKGELTVQVGFTYISATS